MLSFVTGNEPFPKQTAATDGSDNCEVRDAPCNTDADCTQGNVLHCNDDDAGTNGDALGENDDVLLGDDGGCATRGALRDDTYANVDEDFSPVGSLLVADKNDVDRASNDTVPDDDETLQW